MKRVLIVDTDKYVRVKFSLLLKDTECEVESVETIPEAVKRMKEEYFDCVILDVETHNARGYEAIAIIRAVSPDTEVIATTSENSRKLETRTREQGIFYYYIKSFDPEELKQAVRNVLSKHGNGVHHDCFFKNQKKTEEKIDGCWK